MIRHFCKPNEQVHSHLTWELRKSSYSSKESFLLSNLKAGKTKEEQIKHPLALQYCAHCIHLELQRLFVKGLFRLSFFYLNLITNFMFYMYLFEIWHLKNHMIFIYFVLVTNLMLKYIVSIFPFLSPLLFGSYHNYSEDDDWGVENWKAKVRIL